MVYDVTDRESFNCVDNWLAEVEKRASNDVIKILIGNKADLAGERKISYEEGLEFAKKWGMKFLETSAKSGTNVLESFQQLTGEIHKKVSHPEKGVKKTIEAKRGVSLTERSGGSSNSWYCFSSEIGAAIKE